MNGKEAREKLTKRGSRENKRPLGSLEKRQ